MMISKFLHLLFVVVRILCYFDVSQLLCASRMLNKSVQQTREGCS